jgi:CRP-like cAMP-binding protein
MTVHQDSSLPTTNRILSQLPTEEYERLSPHLETFKLTLGDILQYPQEPLTHVYFPNRGTVSVIATFEDGEGVEVGIVGNEGVFGINVVLGSISTPHEALVQLAGDALRIPANVIREEFKKGGMLQDLMLRYAQAFIIQIAQTAACNRSHPIGGRLARWLLMSHDRSMNDELLLTHEFIAIMLGTRRAGVSEAAGKLQSDGVIRYKRGHIHIVDRQGLESISCECYPIVKREFDRLLGNNNHTH